LSQLWSKAGITKGLSRRNLLKSGLKVAAGIEMGAFFSALEEFNGTEVQGARYDSVKNGPLHVPDLSAISGTKSLKAHAEAHSLLYGSGVDAVRLRSEPGYAELVSSQCDIIAAENDMKWYALRPSPSSFNFDMADWLVSYCEKNKIKLRGHVLVWDKGLPPWFTEFANTGNARQLLMTHIQQVVGRYAGRMHSWDVVNEVIDVGGSGRVDSLRNSPWLQLVGADYIELAFRTARDADPTALLTYNEYGIELETPEQEEKRAMVLLLLRRLKARQTPIDALGIQSHLGPVTRGEYGEGLRRFMAAVRQMEMQVFITELDVNDKGLQAATHERDEIVAATYSAYLNSVLPERAITTVMTWGITDRYSWQNNMPNPNRTDRLPSRPLLFDAEYRAKPAFFAVRDSFDQRKLTQAGSNDPMLAPQVDPYAPFNPVQSR